VSNLSGQGDHLDASLQIPLQRSGGAQQGAASLAWRFPLGAMALPRTQWLIGAEQSDAAVVEQPVRQLGIESRVRSVDTGFAHTLWETPAERAGLGLQLQWRQQQSWLLGEPFSFTPGSADGRVRERLLRFWQEAQWRSTQQLVALRSSFSVGRSNVQAQSTVPGGDPGPAPSFLFWTGQAQWLRPVGDAGTQLSMRLNTQWSRDRLLAIDGLSAGGVRSVRGHRENALVRDEGAVASIELEHPLRLRAEVWQGLNLNLLAFYEHARLRNRGQAWATLASVGLGLQASWQDWQLDLSAAHRLQSNDSAPRGSALQDKGVHLQINRKW
jgi:hemolysin activation/secretion protein